MLPHFTSRRVKAALTQPIIIKWITAFESLVNASGQLYPVFEEPISPVQLLDFCWRVRKQLALCTLATGQSHLPGGSSIARVQAFARVVACFPELAHCQPTITPFRDYEASSDDFYQATVLLRSLDIISSVYRTRDIDPQRPLNYFEAAKILTRIAHLIQGKPLHKRLFLAHASSDKEVVRQLRPALQARGFVCIYDEADLALGAPLKSTLALQLHIPDTSLVILWSKAAARSQWVAFELATAQQAVSENGGKIFILRLDNSALPDSFAEMRCSDFLYCRSRLEYERMCDLDKNCEEIYFAMLD